MQERLWRPAVGLLVVSIALWGASDPIIGTWKLNPAKSKDTAGRIPSSLVYTYSAQKDGMIKLTRDEISDQGQSRHTEWLGKFNGKDYPNTGSPEADTMSVKQVDSRNFEFAVKKQGQVVATQKTFISDDGKTLTNVNSSKDAKGQPRSYTAVFERQ